MFHKKARSGFQCGAGRHWRILIQNSGDSHIRVKGVAHDICEMHILVREDVFNIVELGGVSGGELITVMNFWIRGAMLRQSDREGCLLMA